MELIEVKLGALARLQKIHSQIDRIRQIRGGLPEEVNDLEDEIEGLKTRVDRIQVEIDELKAEISKRNQVIKESQTSIKKYEGQQKNVKNNREFEALNKEIELASLEVLTSERRIKILTEQIQEKMKMQEQTNSNLQERSQDLIDKKSELDLIVSETEAEEKKLLDEAKIAATKMEDRVLVAFEKIRRNMRNGLSVVSTDRGACGGCFAIIPPQRQAEIRQKKKIIVCENCGRILVDRSFFDEPVADVTI